MNIKKPILLFLALLLPIAVFVFLKFFGKNEFEVTPLFADKIEQPTGCEDFVYTAPYVIPEAVASKFQWSTEDSLSLFVFVSSLSIDQQEMQVQLTRILTTFANEKFKIYALSENRDSVGMKSDDARFILSDQSSNNALKKCVFLLDEDNNTVLLDSKRQIRGQYTITNREEADRLILEMKIMLKQY